MIRGKVLIGGSFGAWIGAACCEECAGSKGTVGAGQESVGQTCLERCVWLFVAPECIEGKCTANLPVHSFYFAAAAQVQSVCVFTYVQASPANDVILFGSSSRAACPPEPVDMYDNQCHDLLMGSQR